MQFNRGWREGRDAQGETQEAARVVLFILSTLVNFWAPEHKEQSIKPRALSNNPENVPRSFWKIKHPQKKLPKVLWEKMTVLKVPNGLWQPENL